MRALLFGLVLLASGAAAQDLGETAFANSGSPEAQEPFLRGLLLLHSFEYDDARDAFREARAIDPGFAMAMWGEAMTHNHPIWQRQDADAAWAAIASFGDYPEGMDDPAFKATARERAYLKTLWILFDTAAADKHSRDDAYAEAMRELSEAYSDDLDARAFYALALLGTAHEGRDFPTYMKAAAVAEEVFDANPRHPGAAHYLIHAYDDPVHAPLGLRPARIYDQIAPAASHALHMPSHIYLALGLWEDVRDMNERSYSAARAASDRRGETLNGHGWHALWWWHYAATELDDRPLADSLLALATRTEASDQTGVAERHLSRMRATHATVFQDWDLVLDAPLPTSSGLSTQAVALHARGLGALATGDLDAARRAMEDLDDLVSDGDASWSSRAAALHLRGCVIGASGDEEVQMVLHREAAALEAAAPLTFGPPAPFVPANEALGHGLYLAGDYAGAIEAYETALSRAPNRSQSVRGLERARAALARSGG